MTKRELIALGAGAVVTVAAFVAGMIMVVASGSTLFHERLIVGAVALAPVAMFAVMLGYAVWWLAMFLMSLIMQTDKPDVSKSAGDVGDRNGR